MKSLQGLIVFIYPWESVRAVWLLASIWCIITGILLKLDARRLRTQAILNK